MKYLVTGKEMGILDKNTSEYFGVPPAILMEQAAIAFTEKLLELIRPSGKILVVCGTGNNGGDGIAAARLLNQRGYETAVYCPVKDRDSLARSSELFLLQRKIYTAYGYPVAPGIQETDSYDIIVDAVFGTGLSRQVTGVFREAIECMNRMGGRKIALDIASGISSSNGELLGTAFRADETITFSFGKAGEYLWNGAAYSGKVHIVPIGITQESFRDRKPKLAVLEEQDMFRIPARRPDSHKGTYGKLLVIAGSRNMAGAAVFSAKAAYRCGTGLVKVLTAEENREILQMSVPEAILSTYGETLDQKRFTEELKWADAVVIGPGIGTGKIARELVRQVLINAAVPMVMDADALNILSEEPELLLRPHTDIIVTPHLGEMSRLTKDAVSFLKTKPVEAAMEFAQRYDVICVLKDARTVTAVPYELSYLNLSGNNGMATAGSGDVLSGIIGGFLAQGMQAKQAAPLGVFIHGRAGDAIREKTGARGMMASDILNGLDEIWNKVDI